MKWLTLPKIKAQLRIEPDFHDEDDWMEDAGETAEDAILELLNRSYEDLFEVYGGVWRHTGSSAALLAHAGFFAL